FLRTAVNDFMDSVHHIWCPLSSQEFQDLPDGAETTLTLKMPYAMAVRIRNTVIRFSLCKTVFRKSDAAFKAGL
ncbi:hypothetical protein, partial [Klebsiella michiganensis]|uniref:hypothetical protein n=1 Tax=Klebsiella michiganensis TaxID=1134687 RepID=UPI0031DB8B2A